MAYSDQIAPPVNFERKATSDNPSFMAVAEGLNEGIKRLGFIEDTVESVLQRLIGVPKGELDSPNAPQPYGALPELMAALQSMHLRLSRIEKNLVAISNTLP